MVRVLYCTGSTFSGGRNRKREEPSSTWTYRRVAWMLELSYLVPSLVAKAGSERVGSAGRRCIKAQNDHSSVAYHPGALSDLANDYIEKKRKDSPLNLTYGSERCPGRNPIRKSGLSASLLSKCRKHLWFRCSSSIKWVRFWFILTLVTFPCPTPLCSVLFVRFLQSKAWLPYLLIKRVTSLGIASLFLSI